MIANATIFASAIVLAESNHIPTAMKTRITHESHSSAPGISCRYVDVLGARKIISDLKPPLMSLPPFPGSRRVAIIHPTMADWIANMAAYDLGWPIAPLSFAFRSGTSQTETNEQWAWKTGADAFLDLTALDRSTMDHTGTIPRVVLRGRPDQENTPWPVIGEVAAQPLPTPCGPS